ncbi:ly6/PLAUR domain-containing protein 8-like [Leptodactylus fuscus]|uniref:ly6/PLAUR domain-containing protein 8-like n=1 Tax=Leptodactylus fuscus TaxID=238119 RepID=UPI003F4E9374
MKTLLGIGVMLAISIPAGDSLWCTECLSQTSSTCSGKNVTCPSGYVCGSLYAESYIGESSYLVTRRTCSPLHECDLLGSVNINKVEIRIATSCCNTSSCSPTVPTCFLTFSQVQKSCATNPILCDMTYNVSVPVDVYSTAMCCYGDMCNSGSITLPPIDQTENGVRCPACFAKSSVCSPQTIKCRGLQNKCFKFTGRLHNSVLFEDWILQGCTTENLCTYEAPTYPHTALQGGYTMTCSDSV